MSLDKCSLGSKRQNLTPGDLLNFKPLLQSKKETADPNDIEIKEFSSLFNMGKTIYFHLISLSEMVSFS